MALKDIRRESVIQAIEEFDDIGRNKMLGKYGGERSKKWYIFYKGCYDQKLICRAAHHLQGLGDLGDFKALESRPILAKLGFNVVGYEMNGSKKF